MKDFFKKNDKFLHKAKTYLLGYTIAMAVLIAVLAILEFVIGEIATGIVLIISGAIGLLLFNFIVRLLLSYMVDVKLIRNKLYEKDGEGNDMGHNTDLEKFYND